MQHHCSRFGLSFYKSSCWCIAASLRNLHPWAADVQLVYNASMIVTTPCVPACPCSPWCYIGKRRLDKAISQLHGQAEFQVQWLPYQLQPNAPLEGINKLSFYNEKFGPARVTQIMPAMAKVGELGPLLYGKAPSFSTVLLQRVYPQVAAGSDAAREH